MTRGQYTLCNRARIGLLTGTVLVTVDANGNANYELVQPVAWDEIKVLPETFEVVAQARSSLARVGAGGSQKTGFLVKDRRSDTQHSASPDALAEACATLAEATMPRTTERRHCSRRRSTQAFKAA